MPDQAILATDLRGAGASPPHPRARSAPDPDRPSDQALREAARTFEAMFLAEMLSHAGAGRTPETFGGGFGEEVFADMLVREQAEAMAEKGAMKLADRLYRALADQGLQP